MPKYNCEQCGASNCKLWRESHCLASEVTLLCAICTAAETGSDISDIDENGKYTSYSLGIKTDQIGNRLPAVPTGNTYWGYTSVPDADVIWWRSLPSTPTVKES